MKRLFAIILTIGLVVPYLLSEDAESTKPQTKPAAATASAPADPRAQKLAEGKRKAGECYKQAVDAYMSGKWNALETFLKDSKKYQINSYMTRRQRADLMYVRKAAKEHRPKWWKKCRSSSNTSFPARIWNKKFIANYMPTESIGFAAPIDIHKGRIRVIVSWQPNLVDNPKPAKGFLAKRYGIKKGDIGEVVVWHELGHNFIMHFSDPKNVITLFRKHFMMYLHIQEFCSDMTALYHCSPRARLATLLIRLDSLEWYREVECHARGAHGIGAILLTHFLEKPDKWPSIHLPPEVPKEDVERKTIIYVYEHIDPKWTLAEDKALRELVKKFMWSKAKFVLRKKGEIRLANGLKFKLMATDDRDHQPKRDAWVTEKLKAAIKSGRADKPKKKDDSEEPTTMMWKGNRIEIPW